MKTVTRDAADPLQEHDVRVHLGDGRVNGPAVARPVDAPGDQDRAPPEIGDLAQRPAVGGHDPDVGRGAVLERHGDPPIVKGQRVAVGIPGNPRCRVRLQADAFPIGRTGFENLVGQLRSPGRVVQDGAVTRHHWKRRVTADLDSIASFDRNLVNT